MNEYPADHIAKLAEPCWILLINLLFFFRFYFWNVAAIDTGGAHSHSPGFSGKIILFLFAAFSIHR